jgi:hypothetical protein
VEHLQNGTHYELGLAIVGKKLSCYYGVWKEFPPVAFIQIREVGGWVTI